MPPDQPDPYLDADPDPVLNRPARLAALHETDLLDSDAEEVFDRLTRLAARLVDVPASFLSLVDRERDFYKSAFGFAEPLASRRQIEGRTFCHYAILSRDPLVLDDVTQHPVFGAVPTVDSLGVRAYAGVPLYTRDGEALGSMCAIDFKPRKWTERDVEVLTELGAAALREIELRAALRRSGRHLRDAMESIRAREEILAVVAHDLRSPLEVIGLSARVLGRDIDPQQRAEAVGRIARASTQMNRLVGDLLESARFKAGKNTLERVAIRAVDLVRDAAEMMRPIVERGGLRLQVDTGGASAATVSVDYQQMLRVFSNLISNAVKFTPAGGAITLRAAAAAAAAAASASSASAGGSGGGGGGSGGGSGGGGGGVTFCVSDTGQGIAAEDLGRLTERHWQADATDPRGAGLGLSIVQAILQAHGTSIEVGSTPGQGSTFSFTLPAAEAAAIEAAGR